MAKARAIERREAGCISSAMKLTLKDRSQRMPAEIVCASKIIPVIVYS